MPVIYTNIVLQHVPSELAVRYLHEFFRLLTPGGVLVFQLPSHRVIPGKAEIVAMPDTAYRSAITLDASPRSAPAGSEIGLWLRVRNTSNHIWEQPRVGPLAIGNHWLDATGRLMVTQDDGRSPLLQVVPPQMEWPVLLTVRAPREPGSYICELDLVHEGITWFAGKGDTPLRFPLDVTTDSTGLAGPAQAPTMKEYPVPEYPEEVLPQAQSSSAEPAHANFPMDGVPRDQVLGIIKGHGGRLVYLEEDRRAGPEWASYRYFVAGTG
jgi:hypothetical protein